MVKFDYLPDGRIVGLRDVFASFNEPSGPVPEEIVALTGITDEMIAGHRIYEAAVSSFAADAVTPGDKIRAYYFQPIHLEPRLCACRYPADVL